jgi:hypothetical protein
VWSPWLILISQLHTKIGVVLFSNEASNVSLMFLNHKLTTCTTKTVWRVHTTKTWHVHSTAQYKIKFRLKNEITLTTSFEHEDVLSHGLLDLFSTAMLVQNLPLRALIPYPSHIKKAPSVLMYFELKLWRIKLFYICIQYELCILIQYENLMLFCVSAHKNTWKS